nr:LysR family transcriptional regulator [Polymorphobacter multimanifer]
MHYFYETATLGSMRLASDRIGVAVSSVSRQIATLEKDLGIPLFERGRRTIRLTEAGQLTYEHYKSQMASREHLFAQIQQLLEVKLGHVEVAVGEGFLCRAFMQLIADFQHRHPGVSVTIRTATTPDAARLVINDEAHMAVIFTMAGEPRLRTRVSMAQPLHAVCAPDHPAARSQGLTLADLARHTLCLPPNGFRIRQVLAAAEIRQHLRLKPALTTDSIHTMRAIVKQGESITVLPHIAIVDDLRAGELVALPLIGVEEEEERIALVHRIGRQLEGVPARMLTTLQGRFRALFELDSPATRTG